MEERLSDEVAAYTSSPSFLTFYFSTHLLSPQYLLYKYFFYSSSYLSIIQEQTYKQNQARI